MFDKYLNRVCIVSVAFAKNNGYSSSPKSYEGMITSIQDNFIEMKYIDKKREKTISINKQFIISVEEM